MDEKNFQILFDAFEVDEGVLRHIESLGEEALSSLIKIAQGTEGEHTDTDRARAVYALGALRWRKAFSPLLQLLFDEAACVRRHAIYALGETGGPNAAGPLLEFLSNPETDAIEQAHALTCLGHIGDEDTKQSILDWSEEHTSIDMKKVVRKAICDIDRQLDAIKADQEREIEEYCET